VNLDSLGFDDSEDCVGFEKIVLVVRIVGGVAVELPVPCIGPDGFPPVEIYCAGIPDFAHCLMVAVAVVALLAVVELV